MVVVVMEIDGAALAFDARARRRIREERLEGPFAGVPFLLKDFLMDYAGERSTYACEGGVPPKAVEGAH